MNSTKIVYLAGNVDYLKKHMAAPFAYLERLNEKNDKAPFRVDYRFVSLADTDFKSTNAATMLLDECDTIIALIDTDSCYAAIAEVAYASAKGKTCYIILVPGASYGNYSLLFSFPNVTLFSFFDDEISEIDGFACSLPKTESPIEAILLRNLISVKDINPSAFIDVFPQFWAEGYRLDFAYPVDKIGIEVDGHDFHKTKEQRTKDAHRDRVLTASGWTILRFTGSEIWNDPRKSAKEIADILPQWDFSDGED